jgi:hypothetical protein
MDLGHILWLKAVEYALWLVVMYYYYCGKRKK